MRVLVKYKLIGRDSLDDEILSNTALFELKHLYDITVLVYEPLMCTPQFAGCIVRDSVLKLQARCMISETLAKATSQHCVTLQGRDQGSSRLSGGQGAV
jgi:hypothetical protein